MAKPVCYVGRLTRSDTGPSCRRVVRAGNGPCWPPGRGRASAAPDGSGPPLPRLWLACACRSQWADRSEPSPARSSAAFTIRYAVLGSSAPAEARRARCWQPDEPAAPLLAVGREKIRALGEFIHKAGRLLSSFRVVGSGRGAGLRVVWPEGESGSS